MAGSADVCEYKPAPRSCSEVEQAENKISVRKNSGRANFMVKVIRSPS
jgi:hypothetical protein